MKNSKAALGEITVRWGRLIAVLSVVAGLGACATPPPPYDYTAFKQNRPASMLVLPPVNDTPEVSATYGVLSQVTFPLAEAGYYVVPVSLMDETFRQNGLNNANEIQDVSAQKLREIFGADAAVYIKVKRYGTTYAVISSETTVVAEARIVDLRTGQLLWQGSAAASSKESEGANQGGLVGLLVQAVITQIIGTTTDASFKYAGIASQRLLAPKKNGVLYGPRSPNYQHD
ncbi:MAG: DUF799 domain-containing protein [Methylibium sp.]|uniref:DUF799 domain-containing protein n=1 Tax=Methylibium sp. TaxID=2067992 RepID=UPI002771C9EF|nr:DUF799 domain-containing protein [Methylibium sp.]